MEFAKLSEYLQKLENTSKRLEITDILEELIKQLAVDEIAPASYLIMGMLAAPFENNKFNIADKMMIRILEYASNATKTAVTADEINKEYRVVGDLGDIAQKILAHNKDTGLSIAEVHTKLYEIASTEGQGSQEAKVKKTSALLAALDALSAKFVVRIILGTTRLGFTELTFIDALAKFLGDKKLAEKIESVYNTYPDIGKIAQEMKSSGQKGLNKFAMTTGIPILAQKPQRMATPAEAIEKMGLVWAEYKFDGTRVQLHLDRNRQALNTNSGQTGLFSGDSKEIMAETYTRNLERTTHQFPDVIAAAKKQIKADSVILDGEAIGYDPQTGEFLPFQETIQRKRKHEVKDATKSIPLKYFAFDILYLNGQPLVQKTLRERKKLLQEVVKPGDTIIVDEYVETDNAEKLHEYYVIAKEKGLEGIIAKKPDEAYQAGARSYAWCKLKKADEKLLDDSIDCVVLGYYAGKGDRANFGIGGFLAGIYDEKTDTFKTITKVGTGLTDQDFMHLKSICDKAKTAKMPANVIMDKTYIPDVITLPKIVVELGGDELSISPTHSAGYALRFPRLLKFRTDKSPNQATTLDEIAQMYKKQKRAKYD